MSSWLAEYGMGNPSSKKGALIIRIGFGADYAIIITSLLLLCKVVIYPRAAIRGSRYRGDSWDPFLDEISAEQLGETVWS